VIRASLFFVEAIEKSENIKIFWQEHDRKIKRRAFDVQ